MQSIFISSFQGMTFLDLMPMVTMKKEMYIRVSRVHTFFYRRWVLYIFFPLIAASTSIYMVVKYVVMSSINVIHFFQLM